MADQQLYPVIRLAVPDTQMEHGEPHLRVDRTDRVREWAAAGDDQDRTVAGQFDRLCACPAQTVDALRAKKAPADLDH